MASIDIGEFLRDLRVEEMDVLTLLNVREALEEQGVDVSQTDIEGLIEEKSERRAQTVS